MTQKEILTKILPDVGIWFIRGVELEEIADLIVKELEEESDITMTKRELQEEIADYETLMLLQHKRIIEANEYWQKITGGDVLIHADLGELLKFLMDRIKKLENK